MEGRVECAALFPGVSQWRDQPGPWPRTRRQEHLVAVNDGIHLILPIFVGEID